MVLVCNCGEAVPRLGLIGIMKGISTMSELNIGTELCARHRAIIRLEGSIEASSVARLKTALMFAIAIGATGLVIDMQKVEFIDSGGMCTLVDSFKAVRLQNRAFALATVSPRISKALEIARLNQ